MIKITHYNVYVNGTFDRQMTLAERNDAIQSMTNIDVAGWPTDSPYAFRDADGRECCFAAAAALPPLPEATPEQVAEADRFFVSLGL